MDFFVCECSCALDFCVLKANFLRQTFNRIRYDDLAMVALMKNSHLPYYQYRLILFSAFYIENFLHLITRRFVIIKWNDVLTDKFVSSMCVCVCVNNHNKLKWNTQFRTLLVANFLWFWKILFIGKKWR